MLEVESRYNGEVIDIAKKMDKTNATEDGRRMAALFWGILVA